MEHKSLGILFASALDDAEKLKARVVSLFKEFVDAVEKCAKAPSGEFAGLSATPDANNLDARTSDKIRYREGRFYSYVVMRIEDPRDMRQEGRKLFAVAEIGLKPGEGGDMSTIYIGGKPFARKSLALEGFNDAVRFLGSLVEESLRAGDLTPHLWDAPENYTFAMRVDDPAKVRAVLAAAAA